MEGITINYIRDILKSYADSLRQYLPRTAASQHAGLYG